MEAPGRFPRPLPRLVVHLELRGVHRGLPAGTYRVIATDTVTQLADTSAVTITAPTPAPDGSQCLRTVNVSTMTSLTTALNAALPGDCINLAAGTYLVTAGSPGGLGLNFNRAGTAANPITVDGPGSSAVIDMNQRQPQMNGSNYLHLEKFRITNLPGIGFWWQAVTGVVLDSMEIDHSSQELMKIHDASHHNIIKNSWFHHSGQVNPQYGEAIYVGNSGATAPVQYTNTDNQILNNTFGPSIHAEGIDLKEGSHEPSFAVTTSMRPAPRISHRPEVTHIAVNSNFNVIDNNPSCTGSLPPLASCAESRAAGGEPHHQQPSGPAQPPELALAPVCLQLYGGHE